MVTRGGLERRARSLLSEQIHQRYGQGTEQSPTLQPVLDDNNNITHYINHMPDGTTERIETDDSRVPGLVRSAARSAIISGAAGGFARGGAALAARAAAGAAAGAAGTYGTAALGAAATGLSRAIPVVGWGMAAASAAGTAGDWLNQQRKINAQYQAIAGGTNLEAVNDRLQEEGFVLKNRYDGGFTETDSRQIFQASTQLGLRDSEREDVLTFAREQYKQLGMSVSQSMNAITLATKNANTNLSGLTKGLKSVSLAARSTGQNAEVLRDAFLQNYAVAAQAGLGANASGLAAGMTNATQGTNRRFDQVNFAGVTSGQQLRITAAQYGLRGPGALVAAENEGGGLIARAVDEKTRLAGQISVGADATSATERLIQEKGGREKVAQSPGLQREIGQEALKSGFDSEIYASQLLALTGVDMTGEDPSAIAEYYVSRQAGVTIEGEQRKAEGERSGRDITAEDRDDGGLGGQLLDSLNDPRFRPERQTKFTMENYASDSEWLFSGAARAKDSAVEAYEHRQNETKQIDPLIEDLITNYGDKSEVGFEVETAKGKKVVSLDDAITYHSDQLLKGTATVIGGENDGESVETAVGYAQKSFKGAQDTTRDDSDAEGLTSEEWKEEHPTDASEATGERGGRVTISPTPELMRLFNFSSTGNAQVEGAAAAGVPPSVNSGPR